MTAPYYQDEQVTVHHGDSLDVLRTLPDASVDAVVTDPPYGIRFMGQAWDGADIEDRVARGRETSPMPDGVGGPHGGYRSLAAEAGRYDRGPTANQAFQAWCTDWATECCRVLKPGGHLVAFGGSRTWHRLAAAVEDAGFEIRDSIAWLYGSGFPKSMDVAKAITGMVGRDLAPTEDAEPWRGWGTALKPAFEPIVVGRKPLAGTVAANVLAHGTGALNIDASRVPTAAAEREEMARGAEQWAAMSERRGECRGDGTTRKSTNVYGEYGNFASLPNDAGRWPANVVLDEAQAAALDQQTGATRSRIGAPRAGRSGEGWGMTTTGAEYDDTGGPSRFFPTFRYEAKAPTSERPRDGDVQHPTVKPLDLMRWLVRLVTPPGGVVLEPFAGSGTTAEACVIEGLRCIAIEREAEYLPLIGQRLRRRDVTAPATVEIAPGAMQDGFDFGEAS